MQTKFGDTPSGLVADEQQEWERLKVHRQCDACARKLFKLGGHPLWGAEDEAHYDALKIDLDWNTHKDGALYFKGRDRDSRHTYTDMQLFRKTGETKDRTLLEPHEQGRRMRFNRLVQDLPAGACCPDTMQCPVEMGIRLSKCSARKDLRERCKLEDGELARAGWQDMQASVLGAGGSIGTPETVRKLFEHGLRAVKVFAGTRDERVTVPAPLGPMPVWCTHGGWVARIVRG